tara:strand:- start:1390 stop:2349 length:960 start_codon:yes stop_codon:yes gene_type:complete
MNYSVIVPLYNEEKNVKLLNKGLIDSLSRIIKNKACEFELIYVDDGSKDKTFDELKKLNSNNVSTLIVKHRINLSQSAALNTGINLSNYNNLIILDGDLQNDPEDLEKMISEYEKGTDMLIGWRRNRKDSFFTKTLPSIIANYLVRLFSKSKVHDHGCAFKIVKKDSIDEVTNWGDFHRLLAARLANNGYKVTEVEVKHNPRVYGKSNYGFSRIFKVVIDLIYLNFFKSSKRQTIYFFGLFSFVSILASIVAFCIMLYIKYILGRSFILTPLPLLVVFFLIAGLIFLFIGILAQLIINQQMPKGNDLSFIKEKIHFKLK